MERHARGVHKQTIELFTASLTLAIASTACGPAPEPMTASDPAPLPAAPPAPAPAPAVDASAGPPYAANPSLHVVVSGPSTGKVQRGGGTGDGYKVTVKLTNASNADVPVAAPGVFFSVRRDNVEYPCSPTTGTGKYPGEPAQLSPGQSFTLTRELSCDMPVPGKYEVRTYLRFGAAAGTPPDRKELVGSIPVEVTAPDGVAHTPYPDRPGLVVVMNGGSQTKPLTADEAKKGLYSAQVDVTNTTAQPIELKNPRVVFSAVRDGTKVKCLPDMEKAVLQGPAVLEPGRTHRFTAPVQCDLTKEGRYEVNGFVSFGEQVKGGGATGKLLVVVAKEGSPAPAKP
ncbi:MAG: hypothetical protein WKG00_03035 [Polyangiaceae bacterium]